MHIHAFTQNKSLFIDVNKAAITNYSYNRNLFLSLLYMYPGIAHSMMYTVKKLQNIRLKC